MNREQNEQPPLFKKWPHWYWLVLAVLVAEIVLFYFISKKDG